MPPQSPMSGFSFDVELQLSWQTGSIKVKWRSCSRLHPRSRCQCLAADVSPAANIISTSGKERGHQGCQSDEHFFSSRTLCVLVVRGTQISRVIFCVFLETDFTIYKKQMSVIFQDNDMEVTEEQLKGDNTPPSTKSTTKEEREDINRGKEEIGDEEEGDNDAGGKEDVEMGSQNPEEMGKIAAE
ncbi:putative O-acetyl-ADP-ribose deacetylase MACROD2 [Scophthalmus maximus]|uniref:Putative O-acetyl-ADP-ribose deacetylase MACROD2 n=1 Tax=Scophthalmus maximus TaxID=52904 RepID=A0A2U9CDE9_SCOMX|nr:putative O-acetyl-ADP-ribose deacetylase MACROD2 [Scophthalmus maximus]